MNNCFASVKSLMGSTSILCRSFCTLGFATRNAIHTYIVVLHAFMFSRILLHMNDNGSALSHLPSHDDTSAIGFVEERACICWMEISFARDSQEKQ